MCIGRYRFIINYLTRARVYYCFFCVLLQALILQRPHIALHMAIYYFNPHNDLALAAGNAHFTPPASALEIERSGAALPLWWATDADRVLVTHPAALTMAHEIAARHGLPDVATLDLSREWSEAIPWGWSFHTADVLRRHGLDKSLSPTSEMLENIRRLSHRRTAIDVLQRLGWEESLMPVEAFDTDEAMAAFRRMGRAVMKLPWSGSGRGIMIAHEIPQGTLRGYVEGVIRRQGSIIVEPYYNKHRDLAMLFEIGDEVRYLGVSVFAADTRGRYTGNIVASQTELHTMCECDINSLRNKLTGALGFLCRRGYRGPAGVDMMICGREGWSDKEVMPCVEVNLRHTMGMVALKLAERGQRGLLRYTFGQPAAGDVILSGNGPFFSIE